MPKNSAKERADLSRKALDLLRSGHDPSDVAGLLKISLRTIQRWRSKAEQANNASLALPQQSSVSNSLETAFQLPSEPPSESDIRAKIESLTDIVLTTLENILRNPDARTADQLRACQLILSVSGWSDPAASVTSKAINFLLQQGYVVTDPNLPPENSGQRGLTDEMAELIKEKILFGGSA